MFEVRLDQFTELLPALLRQEGTAVNGKKEREEKHRVRQEYQGDAKTTGGMFPLQTHV